MTLAGPGAEWSIMGLSRGRKATGPTADRLSLPVPPPRPLHRPNRRRLVLPVLVFVLPIFIFVPILVLVLVFVEVFLVLIIIVYFFPRLVIEVFIVFFFLVFLLLVILLLEVLFFVEFVGVLSFPRPSCRRWPACRADRYEAGLPSRMLLRPSCFARVQW